MVQNYSKELIFSIYLHSKFAFPLFSISIILFVFLNLSLFIKLNDLSIMHFVRWSKSNDHTKAQAYLICFFYEYK